MRRSGGVVAALLALGIGCVPPAAGPGDEEEDPSASPGVPGAPAGGADAARATASRPSQGAPDAAGAPAIGPDGALPPRTVPSTDAAVSSADRGPADAAPSNAPAVLLLTFSPAQSTFAETVDVKIESDDPRATIYYTLDDKPPTEASTAYRAPIRLAASTVVRALAVTAGGQRSPVANRAYLKIARDAAEFTSNLPVVLLHSLAARPNSKSEGTRTGTITVFEPAAAGARVSMTAAPSANMRMGIHVRGSSSSGWPKKSYKVETWDGAANEDAPVPLLGMPREADWVLFGPFSYDRAMVRNPLIYAISNQMGRWAPRTRFAEVFFTDGGRTVSYADYLGVYVVIEKIEPDKSRLPISKLEPTDIAAPNVTGGYVFKIDRLNSGERGLAGGLGPSGVWAAACPPGVRGACGIGGFQSIGRLSYFYPDEVDILKVPIQVKYLTDTLNAFANALAARQDYGALIDTPAWIDHHILHTFTKNMDAHRLSAYFHKNRGGKLVAGPVWDFDRTLGCTTDYRCPDPTWWDATNQTDDCVATFNYGWWRGLFDDPKFKSAYFARFGELLGKELSIAHLHATIDMLAAQLGTEAPARNFRKWTADAPVGGHAAELARLKDWIARRVRWIQGCLALPDPEACRGG